MSLTLRRKGLYPVWGVVVRSPGVFSRSGGFIKLELEVLGESVNSH